MNPLEQTELLSFEVDGIVTPTPIFQNLEAVAPPSPIVHDPKANVSVKQASL